MSGKYSIYAKDYKDIIWQVALLTDSRFKAIKIWLKALLKYELIEFVVRK